MAAANCPALSANDFLAQVDGGARVLDVRPGPDWAASHLRGSIFVGFSQMLAKWVEALLDSSASWVLIADPGQESALIETLTSLGFGDLRGYLEGGFVSLAAHPERLVKTERVDQGALAGELSSAEPPYVVDVRQPSEWQAGRIGNAPNVPLTEIEKRSADVPKGHRVILHCQGGYRSLIALSLLEHQGHEGLVDMEGGFGAWVNGGQTISPPDQ